MSSNGASSDGSIDYNRLYVYAGPELPDHSTFRTYKSESFRLFGHHGQANIIGSSHYISVPGIAYRELTVCVPPQFDRDFRPVVMKYLIDEGISATLVRHAGPFTAHIDVQTAPISDRHGIDDWDLVYTFEGEGPSAPTAIDFTESGWDTLHRYPEFGTDLLTRTTFIRRDL